MGSSGAYYRLSRAALRSVQLSDTEEEGADGRLQEAGADGSVASSVERRQIRQQLDAVHSSINQLSGPALMAAATTGGPGAAGGPTMESLLGNIASRLASIEGMYAGMTGKLDKVDNRVEDSERNIRDLQHFSAGTIQETARLVDYLGGRATPPASRASMAGTARRHAAAAAAAPPPAMALPRSPLPALDYVPGHLSGTIQQHASQIHKLIAGLDFLESHIIRHDQAIEAVQKQVLVVRDTSPAGMHSPDELTLRLNDVGDAVGKVKKHMYVVEKKQADVSSRLADFAARLHAVEAGRPSPGSPDDHDAAGSSWQARGGPLVTAEQLAQLVSSQEDLRVLVRSLGRDLQELRDQAKQQQAAAAPAAASTGAAGPEDAADMRRQLEYLMSQVPMLVAENAELKKFATRAAVRMNELAAANEELRAAPPTPAPTPLTGGPSAAPLADEDARMRELGTLSAQVAALAAAQAAGASAAESLRRTRSAAVQAPTVEDAQAMRLQAELDDLRGHVDGELSALRQQLAAAPPPTPAAPPSPSAAELEAAVLGRVGEQQAGVKEAVVAMVAGMEQEQMALKEQVAALAEETSKQQAQLAAAVAAVAAELAQAQATAAAASPPVAVAEELAELKEQLREQISGILDKIKERVKENVEQMNTQVSALQDQLSAGVRAEQLAVVEQRLEELAQAQAASGEQAAAGSLALEALRSDVLVLGGQQGILSSKVEAVEGAVADGVTRGDVDALNGLVNDAATRLAADIEQLREGLSGLASQAQVSAMAMAQESVNQATARLIMDLRDLQGQVQELGGRLATVADGQAAADAVVEALAAKVSEQAGDVGALAGRVEALRARMEEDVAMRVQQAADAVAAMSAKLQRDYITREQLGLIFAARADMKRALDELSSVFETGRLMREAPVSDAAAGPSRSSSLLQAGSFEAASDTVSSAAIATAAAAAASAATSQLQSALDELSARQADMTQQVQLLLYRSENSVRHEQLSGLQRAMVTLEMQVKRLTAAASTAAAPAPGPAPVPAPAPAPAVVTAAEEAAEADTPVHLQLSISADDASNSPIHVCLSYGTPAAPAVAVATPSADAPAAAAADGVPGEVGALRAAVEGVQAELLRSSEDRQAVASLLEELQDQIAVLKAAQAAPAAAVESPVRLQILVADAAPAASEQAQQLAALQEQLLFLQSKVAALAAAATAAPATPALLAASTSEDLAAYAAATSAERTLAVVQTQQQEVLQSVQELQQQLGLLAARTDALALVQQQQQEAIQEASAAPAAAAVPAEPPSPATAQTRAAAASSVSASPSSKQLSSLAAAGQGQFLVRLVEVVKRQSSRLRSQYADSEADVGGALAQVESKLDEVEAHLSDSSSAPRDMASPAYAEAMVTVLEQVAALRYIGSQTHPAIQQMVLAHEAQLQQISEQLDSVASSAAGQAASAALSSTAEIKERMARLEGQGASLERVISSIAVTAERINTQASARGNGDEGFAAAAADAAAAAAELPMAALAAKLTLVDEAVKAQAAELQELQAKSAASSAHKGEGSGPDSHVMAGIEQRLGTLHAAATAMRNRLVVLQEYVDSTQGMIKDMHVALGGLHRRVDGLEASRNEGAAYAGDGAAAGASAGSGAAAKQLQTELAQLQSRLLSVEVSTHDMVHTLAGTKAAAVRLGEAETKISDLGGKVAAIGSTMPVLAGQVKGVERKLHARLDAAYGTLDTLGSALAEAAKIQAGSTANPFKAISAAVNNPVVVAMERKLEAVRAAAAAAAEQLAEDLRREQRERAGSADSSMRGGGSGYGAGR